jgi:hypothetical protein
MTHGSYLYLVLFLLILSHITNDSFANVVTKNEKYYNHIYCSNIGGEEEFRLNNKTRVDCLTDEFAIEMDWAKKWYEGITQALYYGIETNKKPKLVLIMKSKGDQRYYDRAAKTINYYKLPISIELLMTRDKMSSKMPN